jgi:hypothetical protein
LLSPAYVAQPARGDHARSFMPLILSHPWCKVMAPCTRCELRLKADVSSLLLPLSSCTACRRRLTCTLCTHTKTHTHIHVDNHPPPPISLSGSYPLPSTHIQSISAVHLRKLALSHISTSKRGTARGERLHPPHPPSTHSVPRSSCASSPSPHCLWPAPFNAAGAQGCHAIGASATFSSSTSAPCTRRAPALTARKPIFSCKERASRRCHRAFSKTLDPLGELSLISAQSCMYWRRGGRQDRQDRRRLGGDVLAVEGVDVTRRVV